MRNGFIWQPKTTQIEYTPDMTFRDPTRAAAVREIRIAARICGLRRLAARTTIVFATARCSGWTREEVAVRMLGVLDEQQERDRD